MNDSPKARVEQFWNEEACGERYGDEQGRKRYELEPEILLFAGFERSTGLRVLEIGVGMGADFSRWVAAGAVATGIDLTSRAIELTRGRLEGMGLLEASPHVDLRQADAEDLPFADESFDLVYSWGVLHHTPGTAKAFSEACRVLAPGGQLKVMVYHRHSWVSAAAWIRFGLLRGHLGRGLREAVAQVESPGTQAFTKTEALAFVPGLVDVSVRPELSHWDRRVLPGVARLAGDRFGWFLLIEGRKQ